MPLQVKLNILLCPPEKSTHFHYPLDPKKNAEKALCTKTPLSRGVTGKTFTDTTKKNTYYPFSDWDCHTGNPVISKTIAMIALNASNAYLNKILVLKKRVLHLIYFADRREHAIPLFDKAKLLPVTFLYYEVVSKFKMFDVHNQHINIVKLFTKTSHIHTYNTPSSKSQPLLS